MNGKRVKDLVAAWLVGNGVLLLIAPRRRLAVALRTPRRLA